MVRPLVLLTALLGSACLLGSPEAGPAPGPSPSPGPGPGSGPEPTREEQELTDGKLPDVDAVHYEVKLRVTDEPGREAFEADVAGTYVATRLLAELELDLEGNTVDEITVDGRAAAHRRDGARLVVLLPKGVEPGQRFGTRVRLHGDVRQAEGMNPNDFSSFGGLMVRQRNADGRRIFTSMNWPSKARRWLPLRDHPRDGATVAFEATFPSGLFVIANGKKIEETSNADGTKTWRYEADTPMPTYDFHVAAYDDWKTTDAKGASGVPIRAYTYAGAASRASAVYRSIAEVLDFYETTYGPYRWGTASFLEEPIFGGGMEHAGVVSMDETLFADPISARETAFHELAHHWSGNLVRIGTWNDFWLSEGFTEYLTARALERVDGVEAGRSHLRGYLSQALAADRSTPHALAPRPVRDGAEIDVLEIFDAISYQKGALVLRQLEGVIGREAMDRFLRSWFERHAGESMTTDELMRALVEATGLDLGPFFEAFVRTPHHPELRVTADATNLTVTQVQARGPAQGYPFPIDVDLVDGAGKATRVRVPMQGLKTSVPHGLRGAPKSIVVDPDEYLLGTVACDAAGACKQGFRCVREACVP